MGRGVRDGIRLSGRVVVLLSVGLALPLEAQTSPSVSGPFAVAAAPRPKHDPLQPVALSARERPAYDRLLRVLGQRGRMARGRAGDLLPLHVERRLASIETSTEEIVRVRVMARLGWVPVPLVARGTAPRGTDEVTFKPEDLAQIETVMALGPLMNRGELESKLRTCHPGMKVEIRQLEGPFYSQGTGFRWDPKPAPGAIVYKAGVVLDAAANRCGIAAVDLISGRMNCSLEAACRVE